MTPNIPSSFNKPYTSLYTNESNSSNYIPAMHQSNIDSYESKNKKTCRVLKTITSVFNSVLLTAGLCTAGFFGFKWLKSSNLSFMSNPLEQVRFSNDLIESSEIKGNEEQKNKLKNIIENCKKEKNKDGTPKGCGVLLQGPPRCGKTLSANVYAKESGLTTFSCKTSSIISTVKGQTEKNIDKMFEQLRNQVKKEGQPVILIMDEIDSFLMSRDNATNEERAMVNAFLRNCDNLEKQGIIILGSTNYGDKCDTAAIGSGRFNEKISFDLPKKEEIEEMLIGKKIEETTSDSYEQEIRDIAQFMFSNNMNWADAQNIKKECLSESDKEKIDTQKAFSYLIDKCKGQSPIQISTLKSDTAPGVNKVLGWDEIYGLDDVKEKFDGWFKKKTPAERESGFLLAGPGGCGKTTLPYALAQKQKTDVYTLRIGDKGVTVDNIKAIIDELKLEGLARQKEGKPPIILFIDEADAMIPNRKGVDLMANVSNSTERTTTLLNAMQNLSNYGICCIAATNNPENIDSPMKRGGRFKQIDIDMPNQDAVIEYIKAKFTDLASYAGKIASKFMQRNKSKLSFANIDGVLKEWKQNVLKGKSNVDNNALKKLDKMIQRKKKQMDAKPLESGLTQIGKSLDEIKEAIQALKDEGTSKKLEELIGFINKNTEQNGEVVKNFNTALNELQTAMEHIANIAESNQDLGNKYSELTKTVARALEGIKEPLDNLGKLPTTIQALTGAINSLKTKEDELKALLETLKNDMPKGGDTEGLKESFDRFGQSILEAITVLRTMYYSDLAMSLSREVFKELSDDLLDKTWGSNILSVDKVAKNKLIDILKKHLRNSEINPYITRVTSSIDLGKLLTHSKLIQAAATSKNIFSVQLVKFLSDDAAQLPQLNMQTLAQIEYHDIAQFSSIITAGKYPALCKNSCYLLRETDVEQVTKLLAGDFLDNMCAVCEEAYTDNAEGIPEEIKTFFNKSKDSDEDEYDADDFKDEVLKLNKDSQHNLFKTIFISYYNKHIFTQKFKNDAKLSLVNKMQDILKTIFLKAFKKQEQPTSDGN